MAKTIWVLTDEKAGHKSQLLGLCDRLQEKMEVKFHWVIVTKQPITWLDFILGRSPYPEFDPPDWVIGAGQSTHRLVLFCKRIFKAKAILLMNPSYPSSWYDACIISYHDKPKSADNIIATNGVMNNVIPRKAHNKSNSGLFLVGGINEHYHWDSLAIIDQVVEICRQQSGIHWILSDSRRTPVDFIPLLKSMAIENLEIISCEQTSADWVKRQLATVDQAWVTSDSVSMVYECITSNVPTGMLVMKQKRRSRVVKAMELLINKGWVRPYSPQDVDKLLESGDKQLWEAERVADWLIQRFGY